MCDEVNEILVGLDKDFCDLYGLVMDLLHNIVKLVSDVRNFAEEQHKFEVG